MIRIVVKIRDNIIRVGDKVRSEWFDGFHAILTVKSIISSTVGDVYYFEEELIATWNWASSCTKVYK